MNDSRFYALLLVILGSVSMLCVTLANVIQPHGVDVELTTRLFTFGGIIAGPIIILLNSNANKKEIRDGQIEAKEAVKAVVEKKAVEIATGTVTAPGDGKGV